MKVNVIVARSLNRAIGINNTIPWSIPEDMKRFKQLTKGHPVIMGRNTWESLPEEYRPLPYRKNIVLTSDKSYVLHKDALLCDSLAMALDHCKHLKEVWIIGGARLYEESLLIADRLEETIVHVDCEGDTFLPELSGDWFITERVDINSISNNTKVTFVTHDRIST